MHYISMVRSGWCCMIFCSGCNASPFLEAGHAHLAVDLQYRTKRVLSRVYDREKSIERRHTCTVYQMYAESNVTSCICHKLGICTLTNPSVGDVIYQPIQVRVM